MEASPYRPWLATEEARNKRDGSDFDIVAFQGLETKGSNGMTEGTEFFTRGDWRERLDHIVETMRELSRQTDPQEMVRLYSERMRAMMPRSRFVSITRRGLEPPKYRIARTDLWDDQPNPWTERDKLPVLEGGLMGQLLYGDEPRMIDELDVAADDPAAEYFAGMRSLVAVPVYDQGTALNVVLFMRERPAGFDPNQFPEMVWMSNLLGRATHNLVMSAELRRVNEELDRELQIVAQIQRSLLPADLPQIPTLDLAVSYQTSMRAGGDYYDLFRLPGGKWGLLVADVSGHGTPAAVLMAITHAIAHQYPGAPARPSDMLEHLNRNLADRYMIAGTFVTAFFGLYDPETRELTYALAGHPPPRLKHCDDGTIASLTGPRRPPLGIQANMAYPASTCTLRDADQLIFYTDGITEARNSDGEFFGPERLDEVLHNCHLDADALIMTVLDAVRSFTNDAPMEDDRTILVARVTPGSGHVHTHAASE